jgi:hypothetical protein
MSFPVSYPQTMSLSIPSSLQGDSPKTFPAAKSQIRSIPSSSASVGPSTSMLFQIPTGGLGFIKSNSMYLRFKCTVAQNGAASTSYSFGSQGNTSAYDWGSASMLINRINLQLGSTNVSYANYNHFKHSLLPHCINGQWIATDDRILESAGVTRVNTDSTADSKVSVHAVPLFIPLFCSEQHFPALLMNGGITLEILTESINQAFYAVTTAITGYSLSEISLVYEEIQVSPEFKSALISSKAGESYNMAVNDYWSVGPTSADQSTRYQIGCGLSSLKAVLWTEQLQTAVANTTTAKRYTHNGLLDYTISVNGEPVSVVNANNQCVAFSEMNRALQRFNDSQYNSFIEPDTANTSGTQDISFYPTVSFLGGANCMSVSDWGYSFVGRQATNVTVELNHGTPNGVNWGNTTAYAAANLFIFLMHDSVYSLDIASGVITQRK